MLKKRLIFTLLHANGEYMLSRNFRLQAVGDLQWLKENYDFDAIAQSVDELVVLDVSRDGRDIAVFADTLRELVSNYFLPIAAGGGVNSLDDGFKLLGAGADKLVVNTALVENQEGVRELAATFGNQCVVASIDCRRMDGEYRVFTHNGQQDTGLSVNEIARRAVDSGAGEIYLTSMDQDGTGFGYDTQLVASLDDTIQVPIILSGGVGRYKHFCEGLVLDKVTGASTANIYNFIVGGLSKARAHIAAEGISMAKWDFNIQSLKDTAIPGKSNDA